MTRFGAGALFIIALAFTPTADNDSLHRLVSAYPQQFAATEKANVLLWKDGTETAYDDGVVKTGFEEVLTQASPKDQMSLPYPTGWPTHEPDVNEDPGRIRCEALFRKMYGASAAEVERTLVDVP